MKTKMLDFRLATGQNVYALYQDVKAVKGIESVINRFMLKVLKITNISKSDINLSKCEVSFKDIDGIVQTNYWNEKWLQAEIGHMKLIYINPMVEELGYKKSWLSGDITDSLNLKPGQSVAIGVQHFDILSNQKISSAEVKCYYNKNEMVTYSFTITEYSLKRQYSLPLKGLVAGAGGVNGIISHRWANSPENEFATDFHILDKNLKPYANDPFKASEYYCYGIDIYSPAEGTVVEAVDGIPDHPFAFNDKELQKLTKRQKENFPLKQIIYGNYLIIDHGNSEYSLLGHLQKESIKVKKGEKIKREQVIAKCGNTGGSDAPHLHYQQMNNSYNAEAIGLPVKFENVESALFGEEVIKGSDNFNWYKELLKDTGILLLKTK